MSLFKHGRYSGFIKPISYTIDLALINGLGLLYLFKEIPPLSFVLSISIGWVAAALVSGFYEVHRFSSVIRISKLLFRQVLLFSLLVLAYSGINLTLNISPVIILKYVLVTFFGITFFKYLMYFLLKRYRSIFKGNIRKTIILGQTPQAKSLEKFLMQTPGYGFENKKTVCFKDRSKLGIKKYGTTLQDNDKDDFLQHLKEELMDAVLYIEKLQTIK